MSSTTNTQDVVIEDWGCQCDQKCCQKYAEGLIGIVINVCYGGFSYSHEAAKMLNLNEDEDEYHGKHSRTDWKLVKAVCQLASKANGHCAKLKVKWIKAKYLNHYDIDEYDGWESVKIRKTDYLIDEIRMIMDAGEAGDDELLDMIKNLKLKSHYDESFHTITTDDNPLFCDTHISYGGP